jgi:hypothetical protein
MLCCSHRLAAVPVCAIEVERAELDNRRDQRIRLALVLGRLSLGVISPQAGQPDQVADAEQSADFRSGMSVRLSPTAI